MNTMSNAQVHNANVPLSSYPRFRPPSPTNAYASSSVQTLEHSDEIIFEPHSHATSSVQTLEHSDEIMFEPLALPVQWGERPEDANDFTFSHSYTLEAGVSENNQMISGFTTNQPSLNARFLDFYEFPSLGTFEADTSSGGISVRGGRLPTEIIPLGPSRISTGSDGADIVDHPVVEGNPQQYRNLGGSIQKTQYGSTNQFNLFGHGFMPMTTDFISEETVTNGSASADTSVSVPDLHASYPSSATSKNVHGSAIQSRHKNKKRKLGKHSTTTGSSTFCWRVKDPVRKIKTRPSPNEPRAYEWVTCSGWNSTKPTPVRTDPHRALTEWRLITQRIAAGEDLASIFTEQRWITTPTAFNAITKRIEGWHANCAKCADLCMGPLSIWLRHLRGPHEMEDAVSLDRLPPEWTLMRNTYRHLNHLATNIQGQ